MRAPPHGSGSLPPLDVQLPPMEAADLARAAAATGDTVAAARLAAARQPPPTYRRMWEPDRGNGSGGGGGGAVRGDVGSGMGVAGGEGAPPFAEGAPSPLDAEAGGEARGRGRGRGGGDGAPVAVQRLWSSSSGAAPSSIHDKNAVTVTNMDKLADAVEIRPDDSVGSRNLKLFEAMQLNPRLLDTVAALASSPSQLLAAQMAAGVLPPAALPPPDRPRSPAGGTISAGASASAGALVRVAAGTSPTPDASTKELMATAEAAGALIPLDATVDSLLLLDDKPKNVRWRVCRVNICLLRPSALTTPCCPDHAGSCLGAAPGRRQPVRPTGAAQ